MDETVKTSRAAGRWFEEMVVGDVVSHAVTRTVTETDNVLFCTMTMNPQPLHLDAEFAQSTEFGQVLVNSLFTLALLVGLSVWELTLGTTVANLGFGETDFPAPVFVGDTIHAETTILEARLSKSRPNVGIVKFEHVARNQHGVIVARCHRSGMIHCRPTTETVK
ncbi:MAG TPA: MaoC family dehydratase [Acidimicrobiales bacterium]